jgi:hypothetical protein
LVVSTWLTVVLVVDEVEVLVDEVGELVGELVAVVELVPVDALVVGAVDGAEVAAVSCVFEVGSGTESVVAGLSTDTEDEEFDGRGNPLVSMTPPRTIETAPHDKANATIKARSHPPISRVHAGIPAVCHHPAPQTLWPRLGIGKPTQRSRVTPRPPIG